MRKHDRFLVNMQSEEFKRWQFVVLSLVLMICLGTIYSYSIFRLSIETYFSVNTTLSGLPYMFALVFYAMSMYVSGRFINRFNPRLTICIGGIIVALGYILSSFATNIIILTLTYGVIGGIGVGVIYGVPIQYANLWFEKQRGLIVGIILVGFGISPLISAPLVLSLVEVYGLMKSFRIIGLVFLIIILLIGVIIPLKNSDFKINVSEIAQSPIVIIHSLEFKGLYINFVIGSMIGLMLVGLTSKVAIDFFRIDNKSIAMLMAFFAILNGLGRPLFGFLVDRFSIRFAMLMSYGMIVFSSIILLIFGQANQFIFILTFSIFWLNLGAWLSIAPSATRILFGSMNYSKNYGIVFSGYGIGAILGILTSGIIMDYFQSFQLIFLFILVISLIGIVLTFKLIKKSGTKSTF